MKKRLTYEAPMGELILVRFEENILSGGGDTPNGNSLNFGTNPGSVANPSYRDVPGDF